MQGDGGLHKCAYVRLSGNLSVFLPYVFRGTSGWWTLLTDWRVFLRRESSLGGTACLPLRGVHLILGDVVLVMPLLRLEKRIKLRIGLLCEGGKRSRVHSVMGPRITTC